MRRLNWIFTTFAIVLLWNLPPSALGQQNHLPTGDELGEATGLAPSLNVEPLDANPTRHKFRGYLRLQGTRTQTRQATIDSGADTEIVVSYLEKSNPSPFLDGRVSIESRARTTGGKLDQAGLRTQLTESWSLAIGKERNRRSPGLIISPSDFIHSRQNLPGTPEERAGVWLARISHMVANRGIEFVALPFRYEKDNGIPDVERSSVHLDAERPAGFVVRSFARTAGFDFAIDAATLLDHFVAGANIQRVSSGGWKSYVEAGWKSDTRTPDFLAGAGYEASSDWTGRVEFYHHGSGLDRDGIRHMTSPPTSIFPRRDYVIANITFPDLYDRFNLIETWIRGIEDRGWINLTRAEWIAGGAHVAGFTLMHISRNPHTQFERRPFDWQAEADWKISF